MFASALPGEKWANEICVKMNQNTSQSIPNIIVCDLKKDWKILIIFGANIFDTTAHQTTATPNICFCTTWKNQNKRYVH